MFNDSVRRHNDKNSTHSFSRIFLFETRDQFSRHWSVTSLLPRTFHTKFELNLRIFFCPPMWLSNVLDATDPIFLWLERNLDKIGAFFGCCSISCTIHSIQNPVATLFHAHDSFLLPCLCYGSRFNIRPHCDFSISWNRWFEFLCLSFFTNQTITLLNSCCCCTTCTAPVAQWSNLT